MTDSNNKKWRLTNVKSIRLSSELLEMLKKEITARNTNLSNYARYAMVMQMRFGNKLPTENAAQKI